MTVSRYIQSIINSLPKERRLIRLSCVFVLIKTQIIPTWFGFYRVSNVAKLLSSLAHVYDYISSPTFFFF